MSFTSRSYSSQKTNSVYGGAGGHGTRISSPTMVACFGPSPSYVGKTSYSKGSFNLADGLDLHVGANEKATLQNLNDRLSTYLDKVRTLEKENGRLEQQIREWTLSRTVVTHDHSGYLATVADLKDKIRFAYRVNAKIILDIDNAKLAADDFKMKFEGEQAMRLVVEADTMGLKRVLDEMNMNRMDLESMYESLKEELIVLKRNHQEDLESIRCRVGGQVDVEVDTPPATDLNQAMTEVREHYETMITKNRKELESWYQSKISVIEVEVQQESELLLKARMELKELKTTCQRLQIDLQSHLSMKSSLEGSLAETQSRYQSTLYGLQCTVTSLEEQLSQLHANIAHHKQEYDMLLDLKTRLEMEIAEYRRLLDGEDESSRQVVTKTITVVETVVDGRVVSSERTTDVDVEEQ
ncbi:unnamed protein product [Gadus morhua 'NCC']